jgi:L,D-transpeptidase catalytic domain
MGQHKILLTFLSAASFLLLVKPAGFAANGHTKGQEIEPLAKKFKPGEYTWHPEISPSGPVVILVSLPDQVMYVYRNGVRIGKSTVSTGAKGHSTPTGVFTVLQKKVDHESSIYKGAKMPHMQRLTWGGIAMHAGNLPGYPASHGCVRLPEDFAEKLYSVTSTGTTVIIADNKSGPKMTTSPGLIFAGHKGETAPPGSVVWQPEKAPKGPVSVIVSAADNEGYVYRNGVEIGRAPVGKLGRIRGTHAYSALATADSSGRRDWLSVGSVGGRRPNVKDLAGRIDVDPDLLAKLRTIIAPGASLILTDMPVNAKTHSRPGFNILTALGPERGH